MYGTPSASWNDQAVPGAWMRLIANASGPMLPAVACTSRSLSGRA